MSNVNSSVRLAATKKKLNRKLYEIKSTQSENPCIPACILGAGWGGLFFSVINQKIAIYWFITYH